MRISSTRIENFRSIRDLTCDFDAVTSLIGPNGAGKSNVLRALDWFFNGEKGALGPDDLHKGSPDGSMIRVQVNFDDLTDDDRSVLGPRYCPDPETSRFTAWRTWQDGAEKITGRARAYPPFEAVRAEEKAADRKRVYGDLRRDHDLPAWTNSDAAEAAMHSWELENQASLEDAEVSDSHFFGINGRGTMSLLFDFVFVSADLRASEETSERKDSLLERIIRRAVDRSQFDKSVEQITEEFEGKYRALGAEHLDAQLDEIADQLTAEVSNYTPGRTINLSQEPGRVKAPLASVGVHVTDRGAETPVTHQGHGFQRTLLLAGLTVLSRQSRVGDQSSSMFLAIEEPELFQHPTQARAFASVLRNLAHDPHQRIRVAYATHSPHFVSPEYFDQVRRVSSVQVGTTHPESRLSQATLASVQERLDGFVDSAAVARRFEQVCLKHLPDALFAERVILVEGDDDAAILEGVGQRVNDMAVGGICVAPVAGKSGMMIPFAILEALEVDTLMVVDNDSGCGGRMKAGGRDDAAIVATEADHKRLNRALCRFVGATEEDYPVGAVAERLAFVPDTLESLLDSDLPGWDLSRNELIKEGRGVEGKHAGTYALAVRECAGDLGSDLRRLALVCVGEAA
jgi:putative ATP-dependent endonuclease of OLD family